MRSRRLTAWWSVLPAAALLVVGAWHLAEGAWIYAKAGLAQCLLQRAWSRATAGEPMPKPWAWADTWPVARLRVPERRIDLIVLAGAHGRTLAFGPAHVGTSALPGQRGAIILTGHRDTHFRFLNDLRQGELIELMGADGAIHLYRVTERRIMDARHDRIDHRLDRSELILVTCRPFEALTPGGPLRYVVRAIPADEAASALRGH